MAEKGRNPTIVAIESVFAALKDLDAKERDKVIASVFALLGMGLPNFPTSQVVQDFSPKTSTSISSRPISLVELINEKKPGTNAQRIAIFAYYREKSEGVSRFARLDLAPYFAKAKITPASNFDRDFVEAVRKGWIHEDEADSYLTTKGIEAIESNFEGERSYSRSQTGSSRTGAKKTKRKKLKRKK